MSMPVMQVVSDLQVTNPHHQPGNQRDNGIELCGLSVQRCSRQAMPLLSAG